MKKKIVVTGGTGRFGITLKKTKSNYNFVYPGKKKLDITNFNKAIMRTTILVHSKKTKFRFLEKLLFPLVSLSC